MHKDKPREGQKKSRVTKIKYSKNKGKVIYSLKPDWPDYDGHQPHDGFIQAVKEVPESLALLLHVTNHQAKTHGEDNKTQSIHSIRWPGHRNCFLHCLLSEEEGPLFIMPVHNACK